MENKLNIIIIMLIVQAVTFAVYLFVSNKQHPEPVKEKYMVTFDKPYKVEREYLESRGCIKSESGSYYYYSKDGNHIIKLEEVLKSFKEQEVNKLLNE